MDEHQLVGFTAGVWDLLHPGHVLFLERCSAHCDHLIVGMQTDPTIDRPLKSKPIQTTFERYTQLKACRFVDSVVPYDTEADLINIFHSIRMDVRFLGNDYNPELYPPMDSIVAPPTITGLAECKLYDIEIKFVQREHTYSSTNLIKRIRDAK